MPEVILSESNQLTMRRFQSEEDYWRIRQFLREVYVLNGRRQLCWDVVRFDYWRWHVSENIEHFVLPDTVFIWADAQGRIAAVLNPDNRSDVFLQVHPAVHEAAFEKEMLAVAEQHFALNTSPRRLCVWADAQNAHRAALLLRHGYTKADWPEYQRRRRLDQPIPHAPLADGYTIRALGDVDELPRRSWASWRAFHPDEPDEKYEGWAWYPNVQRAPLYRRDLDLVAIAPDDTIAAFCTVWFDDVTRAGVFEPVGTVPEHQRRGLGKAIMHEGLRRLQRLGATQAHVGSYSPAAHALYASAGFVEYDLAEPWVKTF